MLAMSYGIANFFKGIIMKHNRLNLYHIDMKYVRNLHNADDRLSSVSPCQTAHWRRRNKMSGINYFNPTSTSGPDGYINYKMSGGDSGGSGGGGTVCRFLGWILIILIVLEVISKF